VFELYFNKNCSLHYESNFIENIVKSFLNNEWRMEKLQKIFYEELKGKE
jgi:hypothetical protein